MSISKKQFDVLLALVEEGQALSQRKLAELTGHSASTVNRIMQELSTLNYVENGAITPLGVSALEPYRVKQAVIIAAGFGSRLVPITLNTPKPLVRIHGKRIIDSLLDALLAAGIEDIYLVRGYLAEQFDQLLYKYPMIKFVENPSYNEANNIGSALHCRYLMSNTYVCEADLLVHNPKIIKKYHYSSEFLGFPVERTDDWCFEVENDVITGQKVGGLNCTQMVGISYWNESDGRRLADHLLEAYNMPGGKELYWEQVPLKVFKDQYKVRIDECKSEDIIEIDTFRELCAIDKSYEPSM